jgi:hypothetical protein
MKIVNETYAAPPRPTTTGKHAVKTASRTRKKQNAFGPRYAIFALSGAAACFAFVCVMVAVVSGLLGQTGKQTLALADAAASGFIRDDYFRDDYFLGIGEGAVETISTAASAVPHPASKNSADSGSAEALAAGYFSQTFNITIEVEDLENAEAFVNGLNGYNMNISSYYYDQGSIADYYRRVDLSEYGRTKDELRALGKVVNEYENVNKLANEVNDLEAMLSSKEIEVSRLKELLAKSLTLDVLAAVERRLGTTESERDDLKGRLNEYYAIAERPYVNIYLRELPPEIEPMPEKSFFERLTERFTRSANSSRTAAENFLIWLVGAFVPIVIIAIIAVFAFVFAKKLSRSKKAAVAETAGSDETKNDTNSMTDER